MRVFVQRRFAEHPPGECEAPDPALYFDSDERIDSTCTKLDMLMLSARSTERERIFHRRTHRQGQADAEPEGPRTESLYRTKAEPWVAEPDYRFVSMVYLCTERRLDGLPRRGVLEDEADVHNAQPPQQIRGQPVSDPVLGVQPYIGKGELEGMPLRSYRRRRAARSVNVWTRLFMARLRVGRGEAKRKVELTARQREPGVRFSPADRQVGVASSRSSEAARWREQHASRDYGNDQPLHRVPPSCTALSSVATSTPASALTCLPLLSKITTNGRLGTAPRKCLASGVSQPPMFSRR